MWLCIIMLIYLSPLANWKLDNDTDSTAFTALYNFQ